MINKLRLLKNNACEENENGCREKHQKLNSPTQENKQDVSARTTPALALNC